MPASYPRLLVAGTSGDSGKTIVTVGLCRAFARQGLTIVAFKKGPDYIDASWLAQATGRAARNLDTFLAAPDTVRRSFMNHAVHDGVNLIEGNRGLHDGLDVDGSHSSAALSKLITCPVILVQNVTKTTRTAAAIVLGSKLLDEGVNLQGVILNRVAGIRHESIVRESIEKYCGVPVLGAIPKLFEADLIPMRHLGLVTPGEESRTDALMDRLGALAEKHLDLNRILEVARNASELECPDRPGAPARGQGGKGMRICYLSDSAFSFYYPENLEALEEAGAELIPVSALTQDGIPACDALYVGGGFPETHATALADNRSFRKSLFFAAESGLPVYAECGGLIYLAERLSWKGTVYPMAGVFPVTVGMEEKPQGHGYARYLVDRPNPFFEQGTEILGHEFHYSRPGSWDAESVESIFEVKRGTGCGKGRDGFLRWNVLATYLHVHALGNPAWARGIVRAAERYRKE